MYKFLFCFPIIIVLCGYILWLFIKHSKDRRKIAEAIREWEMTFDAIEDGISIHSINFVIVEANVALCKLLGKTKEELIGKKCHEVFHHRCSHISSCPLDKAKNSRGDESLEIYEPVIDRWVTISVYPVCDREGKFTRAIHVMRDISERKRLEQMRDEFVSTVSHELRTPLSIVREGVSQVSDRLHGEINPKQEHLLSISLSNIDRINRIVAELLDLSRLEAGKLVLKKESIDLVKLAREVVLSFRLLAEAKKIELRQHFPEGTLEGYLDKDKITQVFANLIGNAIKFTEKGFVEVIVRDKNDYIECVVSDSGIGIPEEGIPELFSKFRQISRQSAPGEKGIGLGLVITKSIVELHLGKIWVESKLGEGTKVIFTLPKGSVIYNI